ncbi:MAG: exosortase/archaeosortase family protein [Candidatus Didemnitutus sp.]|nr:exosortase/archaeosortase family protein [Candidatus Didemnitutus sp.]
MVAPVKFLRHEFWWWALIALQSGLVLVPLSVAWKLSSDAGHSWAVPLLMGYLYWERWAERPVGRPAPSFPWWGGVVLALAVLVAVPLRLFLEPYPLWPALLASYVGLCAGMVALFAWLAGGRAWLVWVAQPMLLLLAGLLWPGFVQRELIQPIREVLAVLSAEVLNFAGKPAIAYGTSVKLGTGWVGVDEACGGIRSQQAAVMIALFAGEMMRLSFVRRLALLLIGIGAALFGNMSRTIFLSWQAAKSDEALAAAHDPAGWIVLAMTMTSVGVVAWWWARKLPRPPLPVLERTGARRPPPGIVLAATLWVVCLAGTELGARWWFDRGETRRESLPQWTVEFPVDRPGYLTVPLPDASRELLRPDHFASALWRDEKGQPTSAYYVEWHRGQVARYLPFLHNPTVCLPLAGCELNGSLGEMEIALGDLAVPFMGYRFRRAGEDFRVYFTIWDPSRAAPLASVPSGGGFASWWEYQLRDVVEARRDQPAQLLTVAVYGERTEAEIHEIVAALLVRRK